MGTISPVLQMRKEKLREIKWLAQEKEVGELDEDPDHLTPGTAHLTTNSQKLPP